MICHDDTIHVEPDRSSSRGQPSWMNGGIKEKASCQRDSKPFSLFKQGQKHNNAPDLFRVSNSELSEVTLPCSLRSSHSDSTSTLNRLDPSRRLETTKGLGCSPSFEMGSILSGCAAYLTSSTLRDETSSLASITTEDTPSESFNHSTTLSQSKTSLQVDVQNEFQTPNNKRMTENSSLQVELLEGFGIIDTTSLSPQLTMDEGTTIDTSSIAETNNVDVGGCEETTTDTPTRSVENGKADVASCEMINSEYGSDGSREYKRRSRPPLHLLPVWRKKFQKTVPERFADHSGNVPVVELPSRRLKVRMLLSKGIKRLRMRKSDVTMQKSKSENQSECHIEQCQPHSCQLECQTEWEIVPTTERLEVLQL